MIDGNYLVSIAKVRSSKGPSSSSDVFYDTWVNAGIKIGLNAIPYIIA